MNTQLIDNLVTTATDIVLIAGLLSPLLAQILRFAKAHTANKRVQLLESYAERVVLAVEQQANLMPSDKKKLAMDKLAEYISASPLKLKVTSKQISDLIEAAVNKLNDDVTPGTKVASEAATDAPEKELEAKDLTDAQKEALEYMKSQQAQEAQQ